MHTPKSAAILDGFLVNLTTVVEQKGWKLEETKGKEQTYRLETPNIIYTLLIHVSTSKKGWWGIQKSAQELIDNIISIVKNGFENGLDWAVVLLKPPVIKNSPQGYLLVSGDFIRMKPNFSASVGEYEAIKINEKELLKELPLRCRFNDWNSFFSGLNLL